jgi:hypothetical protein
VDRDQGDDESLERALSAVDEPAQLVIAQASGQVVNLAARRSPLGPYTRVAYMYDKVAT